MSSRIHASYKQANIDKRASMNHANPKTESPVRFAPFSTSARNRGKTPESANIIEIEKCD